MPQFQYGLLHGTFDESIYPFTLKFNDVELETEYTIAKISMKLLTTSSKRFLIVILIGFILVVLLDMGSAMTDNPQYAFVIAGWAVYFTIFPTLAWEICCLFCNKISFYRGVAITIVGCLVLFFNSYSIYYEKIYYPYVGIEYFYIRLIDK